MIDHLKRSELFRKDHASKPVEKPPHPESPEGKRAAIEKIPFGFPRPDWRGLPMIVQGKIGHLTAVGFVPDPTAEDLRGVPLREYAAALARYKNDGHREMVEGDL